MPKKMLEIGDVGILAQVRKTVLAVLASKLGSCRQNKMDAFFDVQRRLKDSSRGVRLGALATLQQLEQAATLAQFADDVVEMLYNSDDSVRENALVTLCKMKPARLALHADAVAARLDDSVWQVPHECITTITLFIWLFFGITATQYLTALAL